MNYLNLSSLYARISRTRKKEECSPYFAIAISLLPNDEADRFGPRIDVVSGH
jgi:hypothetical protein